MHYLHLFVHEILQVNLTLFGVMFHLEGLLRADLDGYEINFITALLKSNSRNCEFLNSIFLLLYDKKSLMTKNLTL